MTEQEMRLKQLREQADEVEAKAQANSPEAFAFADMMIASFALAAGEALPPQYATIARSSLAAGYRAGKAAAEAELAAELESANAAIPSPYRVN